jgi:hypothetical protein
MKERRRSRYDVRESAETLAELADRLDTQADAIWAYARDCARWGLCEDAGNGQRRSRELRIGALIGRANAAALTGEFVGIGGAPE